MDNARRTPFKSETKNVNRNCPFFSEKKDTEFQYIRFMYCTNPAVINKLGTNDLLHGCDPTKCIQDGSCAIIPKKDKIVVSKNKRKIVVRYVKKPKNEINEDEYFKALKQFLRQEIVIESLESRFYRSASLINRDFHKILKKIYGHDVSLRSKPKYLKILKKVEQYEKRMKGKMENAA